MKVPVPPDPTKMKELILHVATVCASDPHCGAVKLAKILFYADFLAYLKRGRSITGQPYFAIKAGPAPQQYLPISEEMKEAGEIEFQESDVGFGNPMVRVRALRKADLSKLTSEDLETVSEVIIKTKKLTGGQLTKRAHAFKGWEVAWNKGNRTPIPYAWALLDPEGFWGVDMPDLPAEQVEFGRTLWKKIAAA